MNIDYTEIRLIGGTIVVLKFCVQMRPNLYRNLYVCVSSCFHHNFDITGFHPAAKKCVHRADSRFAPSQWETVLLCTDVSHWLGARQNQPWCTLQGHMIVTICITIFRVIRFLNILDIWIKQCTNAHTMGFWLGHTGYCKCPGMISHQQE